MQPELVIRGAGFGECRRLRLEESDTKGGLQQLRKGRLATRRAGDVVPL